jgi:hypothetical protein
MNWFSKFLRLIGLENAAMIKRLVVNAERWTYPNVIGESPATSTSQLASFMTKDHEPRFTNLRSFEIHKISWSMYDLADAGCFYYPGLLDRWDGIIEDYRLLLRIWQPWKSNFRDQLQRIWPLELRLASHHIKWSVLRAVVAIKIGGQSASLHYAYLAIRECDPYDRDEYMRLCRTLQQRNSLAPFEGLIFSDTSKPPVHLLIEKELKHHYISHF